jgi:carboxyl-terminal processing protease
MDHEPVRPASRPASRSLWPLLFFVSLGLLIAVVAFGAGMLAERDIFAGGSIFERRQFGGLDRNVDPDDAAAFPRLAEVRELIEDEYYYRPASPEARPTFAAQLERDAVAGMAAAATAATPVAAVDDYLGLLEDGALRGMTDGLRDEYSAFFAPPEQATLAEELAGEIEGIGVYAIQPEGRFTIVSVIPGSPAHEAGLRPNDVIDAADGTSLQGITNEAALALIRGPAGSTVTLTIVRPGEAAPLTVEVERRAVALPVVNYEPAADGRVAVIQATIFNDKTTEQLDAALGRAKEEGVDGIVLDLRHNGGGWVTGAREMVGRFVPADRGPALYEDGEAEADDELIVASILGGGVEVFDLPLAVLVDGGTASAAEIVAGALRHYGRATLVGAPTFGKGLVQIVHDLPDGSSVRVTTAEWFTPDERPIPETGLLPDVPIELPPTTPPGEDPQRDRAVQLVLGGG